MKMQSLAVIFAIIILPIVIAVSIYINIQEDTLTLQTSYDTKLHNATYDAIKAFQLNEINSNTQNIATEKIRDIEASVETFYNSLAMSLNLDAFGEEELGAYIPALTYTLYDGYYIYSAFYNTETGAYERGLKPFIYYSGRYQKSGIDITVNYTLDNYVTIYGFVNGQYITKSGYLINPNLVTDDNGTSLRYKGHLIEPENLKEMNTETYTSNTYHRYKYNITENNQREKIYFDGNAWYRFSVDRRPLYLTRNIPTTMTDNSAYLYYKEAQEFSQWVNDTLGKYGANIKLGDAVGYEGNESPDDNVYFIPPEFANESIFDLVSGDNDPEDDASIFNEHRRNVIKYAIQTNLNAAIAGYNQISQVADTTYNFRMPVLKEYDWDNILNNISLISFMQGLPIKGAYYNGYSIVTNNKNREFIDPDFIFFSNDGEEHSGEYHSIYDYEVLASTPNLVGYRNIDFGRKKIPVSETINETKYFYPRNKDACYNCIITTSVRNKSPDLFLMTDPDNDIGREKTFSEYLEWLNTSHPNIAKAYYTAIGRERYSSYKSNKFY